MTEVMQYFLKDNLGLELKRSRYIKVFEFKHAFVVSNISDINFFGDQTLCFPLYLYPETSTPEKRSSVRNLKLFEPKADFLAKKPNLSSTIIEQLTRNYKKAPPPEQIFFYIYAVFYSNIYRTKYSEFLKIDFPRTEIQKLIDDIYPKIEDEIISNN